MERRRRTLESGAISTKSSGTTLLNVTQKSLVVEIEEKESSPDSKSDLENNGRRQIIDADPTATVATAKIQPKEPVDPKEVEFRFHSQMWVKGTPLHFIIDSRR
jgi:hypothetical protein